MVRNRDTVLAHLGGGQSLVATGLPILRVTELAERLHDSGRL
jgi:hypothetical protein